MARELLPANNLRLGTSLFALARARLALGQAATAEPLLREALAVRSPPYPAEDPRVLEVQVALVNALEALDKPGEAEALRRHIDPLLKTLATPHAENLLGRLTDSRRSR